jgi:hypothetical protein
MNGLLREVFGKGRDVTVVEESRLVFFVTYGELAAGPADIRLVAIGANQLIHPR